MEWSHIEWSHIEWSHIEWSHIQCSHCRGDQQPAREVGVFVVLLWLVSTSDPLYSYMSVFCKIADLSWCFWVVVVRWCFCAGVFGVFVVVVWWWWCFLWCQHPARELILFGNMQDCCCPWYHDASCGGVDIRPENSYCSVICKIAYHAHGVLLVNYSLIT